jgi:hypothetical protein
MRNTKIGDARREKLCHGFSLLDDRDKEYMAGILQALHFAARKRERVITAGTFSPQNEENRQGSR